MPSFLEKGKQVEREFSKVLAQPIFSSKEEDITEHWDVMDDFSGYKYDVKGMKKIHRLDKEPNQFYHWIELKNVNGDGGWLYGKADYIVFEMKEAWLVVWRQELTEQIDNMEIRQSKSRVGRKDLIVLIHNADLILLDKTEIINKE